MAGNFIKGGMVKLVDNNKVVIDNNEIIKKRLEELRSKMEEMEDESSEENALDEFSEGIDPVQVALLVSDDSDTSNPDDNANDSYTDINLIKNSASNGKGFDKGYDEGFAKGKEEGYNDGLDKGYAEGHDKGYSEGQSKGHSEGFDKGLVEARQQLEAEYNQKSLELQTHFSSLENQLNEDYMTKVNAIEPMLVDKIMDVIAHVTGISLEGDKTTIVAILKSALENMDSGKHFLIHISPVDFENVKDNKENICKGTGILEDAFELIEDNSVPANGALIETDSGIFDCGLGSQLELLKKQLMLLSYE